MKKLAAVFGVLALVVGGLAWAQTTLKADQGRPGNQGAWPVTLGNAADGGSNGNVPYQCNIGSPNKLTVVDGGGTITVPATSQAWRVYTNVCNSPLNAAGTIISCRADGTAPGSVGLAGVGDVLQLGDCVTYTVRSGHDIYCVANTVAASVNSYECY